MFCFVKSNKKKMKAATRIRINPLSGEKGMDRTSQDENESHLDELQRNHLQFPQNYPLRSLEPNWFASCLWWDDRPHRPARCSVLIHPKIHTTQRNLLLSTVFDWIELIHRFESIPFIPINRNIHNFHMLVEKCQEYFFLKYQYNQQLFDWISICTLGNILRFVYLKKWETKKERTDSQVGLLYYRLEIIRFPFMSDFIN